MRFSEAMNELLQVSPQFTNELTPTNTCEAKEEFLMNDAVGVPNFNYDESTDYDVGKAKVENLLRQFGRERFSEVQKEILEQFAMQVHMQYDLLQMVRNYRHTKDDTVVERIFKYSCALHGMPDPRTYRQLWRNRQEEIVEKFKTWPGGHLPSAYYAWVKTYKSVIGELPNSVFVPKDRTVIRFRDFCQQRWSWIFQRVDLERIYTAEEVCGLLNTSFYADHVTPIKWRAVISENKTSLDTNQITRELEIPRHRGKGPYTGKVVRCIILGHEVMVHIARREYAEEFYPDVAVPLPDYLEFEEGLAKAVEQALDGEFEQAGIDHYLTAGMVYYDRMDFETVFATHERWLFLKDIELNDTPEMREKKRKKAIDEAFRLTTRCLRGTEEVPLFSNLTYYNGQVRVWRYIEENINQPEKLEKMLFRSGKTDPTNPLHQRMLRSLGWKDEDF